MCTSTENRYYINIFSYCLSFRPGFVRTAVVSYVLCTAPLSLNQHLHCNGLSTRVQYIYTWMFSIMYKYIDAGFDCFLPSLPGTFSYLLFNLFNFAVFIVTHTYINAHIYIYRERNSTRRSRRSRLAGTTTRPRPPPPPPCPCPLSATSKHTYQ